MAQPIKVPVHYTTVFKNQYSRHPHTREIAGGTTRRFLRALVAFALVGSIAFAVIVAALLTN